MFENGYIKLHRSILSWEWYKNENTKSLFLHLLLKANFEPARFEGHEIPAGSLVTSFQHLAKETGMSVRNVRTSLEHLKSTHEVTQYSTAKFTVISIVNWELYQCDATQLSTYNRQTTDKQLTSNRQTTDNNIRNKEYKEEKEEKEIGSIEQEDDEIVLTEEEAKQWEIENGRAWEGWIQY